MFVVGILLLALIGTVDAATLAPSFSEEVVATGFNLPTAVAFLPDERILVAQKSGIVKIIKDGVVLPTQFVDLSGHVNQYWDRGLIAMAVDPNFATNGRVYFFYTYEDDPSNPTGPKTARLTSVTASGDVGGPETVLIGSVNGPGCATTGDPQCIPQDWYGHSADSIIFASTGTMFVTLGDAASWDYVDDLALRAQDIDEYPGKILRITTDGQGLADNPFYDGDPNSVRSRVWAFGFRNPFRFEINPGNGIPYVGDVGWDTWEEIDVATAGANFGWPCYEGPNPQVSYSSKTVCQQLYTQDTTKAPLIAWNHNGEGASAVGGPFTPPQSSFPSLYHGGFFYADYALNWIRFAEVDANNQLVGQPLDFATNAEGPVDLEFGPDGNLYYISIVAGELRRVTYAPKSLLAGDNYLSDLSPASLPLNGWGPMETDQSNGELAAGDGGPLTIGGQVYAKGLGVHARSEVVYDLGGNCTAFTADAGVDDEVGSFGSVTFEVWNGATAKLFDSGLRRGTDAALPVSVDVTGVSQLRLVVTDGGNDAHYDHADWANAQVACGPDGTPPVISAIGAVPGSTSATVSWQTDEAADSQVEYGLTSAYGWLTVLDSARVTSHSQLLGGLDPTMTYHYRVISRDAAGNIAVSGDHTFTTITTGSAQFLSDWVPVGTPLNGWGPMETDQSNGELAAGDGGPLTIGGQVYAKGLGVHARSEVVYDLGGNCTAFTADAGVDDEVGSFGSVTFEVWNGATAKLFDSGLRRGTDAALPVSVDVTGVSQLRLVVTDGGNDAHYDHADWANAQVACGVANTPPAPTIVSPAETDRFAVGDTVALSGSATDAEDGNIPSANLSWDVVIEHCPNGVCHFHPLLQFTGASATFEAPDHGDDSYLRITLTAVDSVGATASVTRDLLPKTAPLSITSSPSGLQIIYDTTVVTTPFQVDSIVNSTHSVEAISPQSGYEFSAWFDGGAQQHVIQDLEGGTTVSASFTLIPDGTPPVISAIGAVPGSTSATVSWQTDEAADSQVEYGLTSAYGWLTVLDSARVTSHSQLLGGLDPTMTYHYRVISRDAAGNIAVSGDHTFTTITTGSAQFLSDWVPVGTPLNGWGPMETDQSNGELAAGDGGPLTIGGQVYAKGLGVHARSEVVYDLGGNCTAFTADAGVDDEVGSFGSVTFEVWNGATAKLFDSGLRRGTDAALPVSVDVTGVSQLRLVVTDGGNDAHYDHADWANAQVACTSGGGGTSLLGPASTYSAGNHTHAVRMADLNGDGKLDLVTANAGSATVSVLLGNGDGTFQPKTDYATAATGEPKSVAIGDLNGDGKRDFVTANQASNNVSVLLGNGDGSFQTHVEYAATVGDHEAAIGDLNRDGIPDIAVAGWGGSVLSVLVGNGNGSFQTKVDYVTGTAPHSIVIEDFNGDGNTDLATANHDSNDISILLGNGNGIFPSKIDYAAGLGPHSIRAGDLNGDGALDLVIANDSSNNASVLLGNGNGTFQAKVDYSTGTTPKSVTISDINSDGRLDIVTSNIDNNYPDLVNAGGDSVSVLLGNGDGTFQAKTDYTVGQGPFSVVVGDLNGDNKPDLATANWHDNNVSVRINTGP